MKVLNFGSLNVDYVYKVDHILIPGETLTSKGREIFCGGKGLNQSIALSKAGIPVYHAGIVGSGGDILMKACEESGVNSKYIRRAEEPCGHTVIQVDKNGQNSILLFSGTNRMITKEFVEKVLEDFEKGDVLLIQNEINELDYIIDKAYEKGMTIILNPSPFDDELKKCDLRKISIFLLNEIEGFQITGEKEAPDILEKIKQLYPNAKVILTLGSEGAVYQDDKKTYSQKAFKVRAVDTTAAGDTFTGYFISSIIEGLPVPKGLELASRAAAIAVSRPGATTSIPSRQEVTEWVDF